MKTLNKIVTIFLLTIFGALFFSTLIAQCPGDYTFTTQAEVNAWVDAHGEDSPDPCSTIGGNLTIGPSSDITDLSGLATLESVGGDVIIVDNSGLIDLFGMENITSIGGVFELAGNNLENLKGLNGLSSVGGNMLISDNLLLSSISELSELYTIVGSLTISNCDGLTNLTGLNNLTSISDSLSISSNNILADLTALGNLATIGGDLIIFNNDQLTDLTGLEGLTYLNGDLIISDCANLGNLRGLNNLISIGGSLDLSSNNILADLTALANVTTIGGDLNIFQNQVYNLEGLEGLTYLNGDLIIGGCSSLGNLTGLDNLTSISGILDLSGNLKLVSLTALGNLTTIGGDLIIQLNIQLANLEGLEGLTTLNGDLKITENEDLVGMYSLVNLEAIGGALEISSNPVLSSPGGLNNVTSIGAYVEIANNFNLYSIGLQYLIAVGGSLRILSNPNLEILHLNDLTSIEGDLNISNNFDLYSLSLSNLNTISGGALRITANSDLASLSGLENINPLSISDLIIENSALLSECDVQSICDYLSNSSNSAVISSNATGCNTRTEVEEACALPVDLIGLHGRIQEEVNLISWQTASEINTDKFTIERSGDGKTWVDLGFVMAGENPISKQTYQFTDSTPLTSAYYRLFILDLDGEINYSNIISLDRHDSKLKLNGIIPNPNSGKFSLNISSKSNESIKVEVLDYLGNELYCKVITDVSDRRIIDISGIVAGVYMVIITQKDQVDAMRMIIPGP